MQNPQIPNPMIVAGYSGVLSAFLNLSASLNFPLLALFFRVVSTALVIAHSVAWVVDADVVSTFLLEVTNVRYLLRIQNHFCTVIGNV